MDEQSAAGAVAELTAAAAHVGASGSGGRAAGAAAAAATVVGLRAARADGSAGVSPAATCRPAMPPGGGPAGRTATPRDAAARAANAAARAAAAPPPAAAAAANRRNIMDRVSSDCGRVRGRKTASEGAEREGQPKMWCWLWPVNDGPPRSPHHVGLAASGADATQSPGRWLNDGARVLTGKQPE